MPAVANMKETDIQRLVHKYLSDTSISHFTASGKQIQILSPGIINVHSGPDFKDIALLINGKIHVGDAEFHKNTKAWHSHGHDSDPKYNNVVLHIAFSGPKSTINNCEHFFIDPNLLESTVSNAENEFTYQDVKKYALKRLKGNADQNNKMLEIFDSETALRSSLKRFLFRYEMKKRRPIYSSSKLNATINGFINPLILEGLRDIQFGNNIDIDLWFDRILFKKQSVEGQALRKEIVINSILPLAYFLASCEIKENILNYYWSIESSNKYGILKRRFPSLSQEYVWQQQGMLEIIKEFYPNNKLKETKVQYVTNQRKLFCKEAYFTYS